MLKDLILSITTRCNLRCRMCDIPLANAEELDTHVWQNAIRDAAVLGAATVVFSGGEPLLRQDLCELISFTKKQKMTACVTSNGTLIGPEEARKLFSAGVDVVNISVEGPSRIHDELRGKGGFEKALMAIKHLKKYNVECTLATVVTAQNFRELPYIAGLAKDHGATTLKLQPFDRMFLSSGKRGEEFFLKEKDLSALKETLSKTAALCREYRLGINPVKYLEKIPEYLFYKKIQRPHKCPALDLSCPVNAQGEVYPCWILNAPQYLLGSLKEKTLLEIWRSGKRAEILSSIRKKGCPGCLMSCYDENFGKKQVHEKISHHMDLLRRGGVRRSLTSLLDRWKKRVRFYSAWRGDLSSALRRVKGKLKRSMKLPTAPAGEPKELAMVLKELDEMKRRFEKESRSTAR